MSTGDENVSYKRVIVVDLASLGLRSDNEAEQLNASSDNILSHVLNQSSKSDLPTLRRLGLFNIFFNGDHSSDEVNPVGAYGLVRTNSVVNKPASGLREMFDCAVNSRVSSVFEEVYKAQKSSVIISRFVEYLQVQDFSKRIQVPNNTATFVELNQQLEKMRSGFIYAQVPELQAAAMEGDLDQFSSELKKVDVMLGELMDSLEDDDLLIVTSSRVGDSQTRDGLSTYKILPVMLYDNQSNGKHIEDIDRVSVIGGTVLDGLGILTKVKRPSKSLIPYLRKEPV
ncbi:phosphopentomutase [Fructilactobacillus fructivorans]|nr:phosphopentomutase [Fructilactobacillus fructivorans]